MKQLLVLCICTSIYLHYYIVVNIVGQCYLILVYKLNVSYQMKGGYGRLRVLVEGKWNDKI